MELKTNKFNEMTLEEMRGTDGGTSPVRVIPIPLGPIIIAQKVAQAIAQLFN